MGVEVWQVISGILAGISIGGVITTRQSGWIVAAVAAVLLVIHVWEWL